MKNKIKRMKNILKFNYEKGICNSLVKRGLAEPIIYSTEINEEGYILRKDTPSVRKDNNVFAVVHDAMFRDIFGKELHIPYISTDSFFDKLSDFAKDFIIEHELFHHRNHKDILLRKCGRLLDLEKEADLGAAKKLGYNQALLALIELKSVADGIIDKEEIDARIGFMTYVIYNEGII